MSFYQYITKNFYGYNLSVPAFYQWDIGLRFELSPPELYQFKEGPGYIYNEEYFKVVTNRATDLYSSIMEEDDQLFIVYQRPSWNRQRIRKYNHVFQNIGKLDHSKIQYKTLKRFYDSNWFIPTWKRAIVKSNAGMVNFQNILQGIANHDFPDRKPYIEGEVFFVNTTKHLILNMYDDRGLDIISKDKKTLLPLYNGFNDWILDYDREKIDTVFKE